MLLLCSAVLLTPRYLSGQNASYKGSRVALFDLELLRVQKKQVFLKCRFANTGRVDAGGKKPQSKTIVELDTANIPPLLWGLEALLSDAALRHLPYLKPGELSGPVWIDFDIPLTPDTSASNTAICADLKIDTAFILTSDKETFTVVYEIENAGNTAAKIFGSSSSVMINGYFVGGKKLTRGALPAGNADIQIGRETLTGWLKPGQRLRGQVKLSLSNRTKFAPNLYLELALPPGLQECDPTNNAFILELKYR